MITREDAEWLLSNIDSPLVKVDPRFRGGHAVWGRARLLRVEKENAIIQPFGHKVEEKVPLEYINKWGSKYGDKLPRTGPLTNNLLGEQIQKALKEGTMKTTTKPKADLLVRAGLTTKMPATLAEKASMHAGSKNLADAWNKPKNRLSPDEREEVTNYVLESLNKGNTKDQAIDKALKDLVHVLGSQKTGLTRNNVETCYKEARLRQKAPKAKKEVQVKEVIKTVTVQTPMPPAVIGILTDTVLSDSEKVRMIRAYAGV